MTPSASPNSTQRYQRIVLTLNLGGGDNQINAIEHTINFAGEFNSNLTCLCVRDSDLLDYAELPFAREFSLHSTTARALNADDVRREMDRSASAIRHALENLTTSQKQSSSFMVVDGRLDEKVVETAEENDLVVMMIPPVTQHSFGILYEKICRIITQRFCDLLLVSQTHQPHTGPVALLVDSIAPSERALQLAFHSAQQRHTGVEVFITDGTDLTKTVKERCESIPGMQTGQASYLSFHSLDHRLSHPWRRYPCSFMVLEFGESLPPIDFIGRALNAFPAPMLLLRRTQT